jgi:hypothetical protein
MKYKNILEGFIQSINGLNRTIVYDIKKKLTNGEIYIGSIFYCRRKLKLFPFVLFFVTKKTDFSFLFFTFLMLTNI